MYNNVSQDFLDTLGLPSRTFKSRITVNQEELSDIKSYTMVSGSCGSEAFSLGTVFSSYINLIIPIQDITLAEQEMFLETGLVIDEETVEYVPMGYFTAGLSDITKSRDQIVIKASDRITSKCRSVYTPTITFPATIQAVLNDIATQAGVTILTSFTTTGSIQTAFPTMFSYEALGYIAGLLGGFCYADRSGNIRIESFPDESSLDVARDRIYQLSVNESEYEMNRISVTAREGGKNADGEYIAPVVYSAGSGKGLDLFNPFMTQALFNTMFSSVLGYSFYPGTVDLLGDPRIDPVDAILAENYEESEFLIPCMSITQTFDGGLKTTVSAPGLASSDSGARGPLSQQVDKLTADIMLANEVIAKKITADEADIRYGTIEKAVIGTGSASDFTAAKLTFMTACCRIFTTEQLTALSAAFDTATAGTITADNISAARAAFETALAGSFTAVEIAAATAEFRKAVVQELYVQKMRADYAVIDFANVNAASINTLLGNSAFFTNIQTSQGVVTGELVGVKIKGDVLHGNTVYADSLILKGADGLYYQINADAGNLTPQQLTDDKYKNGLDGSVIVANSVTATQINVNDLFAQNILFTGTFHTTGKNSVDSTAQGVYMDRLGQFATGDGFNYLISWYDTVADEWKLAIQADELNFGTGESVKEVVTNAANTASTAQSTADSAKVQATQNADTIRVQGLDLEAFREEIRLAVASLVNSTQIFKGDPLEDYQSDEIPTLLNYPTFTDFFIWDKCADDLYCSDSLICGTNNYAAHEDEILLHTIYNDFYQFREDTGEYSWEKMTIAEVEALSNKYSYISVDENGVLIKVSKNNQTNQLYISYDGITPSRIYCC